MTNLQLFAVIAMPFVSFAVGSYWCPRPIDRAEMEKEADDGIYILDDGQED